MPRPTPLDELMLELINHLFKSPQKLPKPLQAKLDAYQEALSKPSPVSLRQQAAWTPDRKAKLSARHQQARETQLFLVLDTSQQQEFLVRGWPQLLALFPETKENTLRCSFSLRQGRGYVKSARLGRSLEVHRGSPADVDDAHVQQELARLKAYLGAGGPGKTKY